MKAARTGINTLSAASRMAELDQCTHSQLGTTDVCVMCNVCPAILTPAHSLVSGAPFLKGGSCDAGVCCHDGGVGACERPTHATATGWRGPSAKGIQEQSCPQVAKQALLEATPNAQTRLCAVLGNNNARKCAVNTRASGKSSTSLQLSCCHRPALWLHTAAKAAQLAEITRRSWDRSS